VKLPDGYQVTSLVVCSNAVVAGGGTYDAEDPAKTAGYVIVVSRETGKTMVEHKLAAPVVFGGIAALEKRLCVALADSSVCLLGE